MCHLNLRFSSLSVRLCLRRRTASTVWTEWKVPWRPSKELLSKQTNWRNSTAKWWACQSVIIIMLLLLLQAFILVEWRQWCESLHFTTWRSLELKPVTVSVLLVQLYRLERYDECKSVYTDLIRNSQDEYEEERKTNLAAVVASMSQWEKAPMVRTLMFHQCEWVYTDWSDLMQTCSIFLQEDLGLPESTYELCYNAACALIGQGQLTEALNKLQQAEGESRSLPPSLSLFYSFLIWQQSLFSFRALQSLTGWRFCECCFILKVD